MTGIFSNVQSASKGDPDNIDWSRLEDIVSSTAVYPGKGIGGPEELAYLGLGIAGEAGEVADTIKKLLRSAGELSVGQVLTLREKLIEEMGDLLWYYARLTDVIGVRLVDIAETNQQKLAQRAREGTLKLRTEMHDER